VTSIDTEVLIIGSGAGGSTTAARLTAAGRRQLTKETDDWRRLAKAVALVLGPELSGG
jgi:2-polyprenyl-6-methoxyphenol hydroxylase-like FAD-dependent oxidoreductase